MVASMTKVSQLQTQRVLVQALRNLSSNLTVSVEMRNRNTIRATGPTTRRTSSSLRKAIDVILDQFEKYEEEIIGH
jgi:hypothetical protein